jgi:hypothetical protein
MVVSLVSVTVHGPVPVQPPPEKPANVDPFAATAVNVTIVPSLKLPEHVVPQLIPVGLLVTVPVPVPAGVTVSTCGGGSAVNVAVTVWLELNVTAHVVALPEQPPPEKPANASPGSGFAVNVTIVPESKSAEHVAPQLIAVGLLVTVPVPVPAGVTVSVLLGTVELKVAVTVWLELNVTVHVVALPEQPPPEKPANVEPVAGAAVNVTCALVGKLAEHVAPQLIPVGLLVTVPVPVPAGVTVRIWLFGGATVTAAVWVVALPAVSLTVSVTV